MTDISAEKGTISAHLVLEALYELRQRGIDDAMLLRKAGIPVAQLSKPYGQVSSQQYGQLWLLIAQAMDDEFFGMNPRRMKCGSFGYMTRAAVKEPTVGEALEVSLRFLRLTFDDLTPRSARCEGHAEILLEEPEGEQYRAFAYFTLWLMVHGMLCWLAGRRIPVIGIDLRCPAPGYIENYRVMFSDNLRFEQPYSRLLFSADCLDQPVRRSERELKRFLAGAPANILVRYRDPQSLGARIRTHLQGRDVARWPDFEALSRHFYMAPSTLRRKLAQEGQSYLSLKNQVRRELAIALLDAGEVNFGELACTLGFADASAFHKAFKKWTGSTPGQYRAPQYSKSGIVVCPSDSQGQSSLVERFNR